MCQFSSSALKYFINKKKEKKISVDSHSKSKCKLFKEAKKPELCIFSRSLLNSDSVLYILSSSRLVCPPPKKKQKKKQQKKTTKTATNKNNNNKKTPTTAAKTKKTECQGPWMRTKACGLLVCFWSARQLAVGNRRIITQKEHFASCLDKMDRQDYFPSYHIR